MFTKTTLEPLPQYLQDLALKIFKNVTPADYDNLKTTPFGEHMKYRGGRDFLLKETGLNGLTSGQVPIDTRFREFRKYFEEIIKIPFHLELQLGDRIGNDVEGPVDQCLHRFNFGPLLIYPITTIKHQLYKESPDKLYKDYEQWAVPPVTELYHGVYNPNKLTKTDVVTMNKGEAWWVEYYHSMAMEIYEGSPTYKLTISFPHTPNLTLDKFYNFGKIDL